MFHILAQYQNENNGNVTQVEYVTSAKTQIAAEEKMTNYLARVLPPNCKITCVISNPLYKGFYHLGSQSLGKRA